MLVASSQGTEMHGVWVLFIRAAIVVYVLVTGLILYAAIRYRRRDRNAVQGATFHTNPPLEIAWTIVPLLVVGGLFAVTYAAEVHVQSVTSSPAEVVDVVAYRWSWRFLYPRDGIAIDGGPTVAPQMTIPLGQTTEIRLTSSDVVHGFWVPAFLFKRQAIPGRTNIFEFTPTKAGTFPGRCMEFCGLYHAHMTFQVRVLPPAQYAAWVRTKGAT